MSGLTVHELWESNTGQVCCPDHLGCEASAQRSANPRALGLVTSLAVWRLMSSDDVADWAEFMAEMGHSVLCEGCRWGSPRIRSGNGVTVTIADWVDPLETGF